MAQGARHVIDDVATIDLLASSARMEIVDALEASTGALSVAALAARLGRPADGLYYHLRQLVAAGLVREQADAGVRTYRIATLRGKGLRLRYQPGATPNARAVARTVASLLRVAQKDFAAALADPASVVEGPRRELWAGRLTGWVTPRELAELNALLARASELLRGSQGKRGSRLVALSWVLAPLAGATGAAAPPRRLRRTRR